MKTTNKYQINVNDTIMNGSIILTVIKITDKTCTTKMVTESGRIDIFQKSWNTINRRIEFGTSKVIYN